MHAFIETLINLFRQGAALALICLAVCGVGLAAAYLWYRKKGRAFPWKNAVVLLVLCGYAALLSYATLWRNDVWHPAPNLHLFRAWREAWHEFTLQTWLNTLLNVAMFLPLGCLLPLLHRVFRRWPVTFGAGLAYTLLIETLQYVTGRGIFDVDDFFNNTLGTMLGFCGMVAALHFQRRAMKKALATAALPLAFVAFLLGGWIFYEAKEYGNLQESPAFTVNVKDVRWTLECQLEEAPAQAPVYRITGFDQESCTKFVQKFAENFDISVLKGTYYDNSAFFGGQAALTVNYLDRSYSFTPGAEINLESLEEETLRAWLASHKIDVPKAARFQRDGNTCTFTADHIWDGGQVIDGTLRCQFDPPATLVGMENSMTAAQQYKDTPVISQTQAYDRLCRGKFSSGDVFESWEETSVSVTACSLEYRTDSKGFYRPVYVFSLAANGKALGDMVTMADP